jgi:hypothetical protein
MDEFTAYCPMIVPLKENLTKEEALSDWKKFSQLPDEKKNIMCSEKTARTIEGISKKYNLSLEDAASISRAIKRFFLGYINENDIQNELNSKIPSLVNNLFSVYEIIKEEIIFSDPREHETDDQYFEKEQNNSTVNRTSNLSISQALKQFPNLGEQLISSGGIKMKYFNSPVRPSIKNWIADYNEVMGVEKHDMMKRGDYLFHSENGKRLTTGERQKVSDILKSMDENSMVSVDSARQEVVFENRKQEPVIKDQPSAISHQPSGFGFQSQRLAPQPTNNPAEKSYPRVFANQPASQVSNFGKPAFDSMRTNSAPKNKINPVNFRGQNNINPETKNFSSEKSAAKPFLDQETEEKINSFFSTPGTGHQPAANHPQQIANNQQMISKNPQPMQSERNLNFSSPHKFPTEFNVKGNNASGNIPKKELPKARPEENYPYVINPHDDFPNSNEPKINGNVVDLRN